MFTNDHENIKEADMDRQEKNSISTKELYDDGNIPEIDLPREEKCFDVIPDEVPRRDGPGGE